MDSMVIVGIVMASVGLYFLLKYGLDRFWIWLMVSMWGHYEAHSREWDDLAAADVRDYEDNQRRLR